MNSLSMHFDAKTADRFVVFSLILYFARDGAGGALRYYFAIHGLSVLWFIPDFCSFICVAIFTYRFVFQRHSKLAAIVLLWVLFSLVNSFYFLGSALAVFSSVKMITPIFVGFCFAGVDISGNKPLLSVFHFLLFVSIGGILLSSVFSLPWVGFAYEQFGTARQAGRLWWAQNEQRLSGFAEDSTMAAFFTLICFVLTSVRKSNTWCLIIGLLTLYAIRLTTNKTGLVGFFVFAACLLLIRTSRQQTRLGLLRRLALISFIAPLVPIVLILLFSGVDLVSIFPILFSMADRINNSWQLPFVYLQQLMPMAYLTGCGAGCFNYPHHLFSNLASYWVPVDNFYLGTYLMFGMPFLGFMIAVFVVALKEKDVYKLTMMITLNVVTITVLNYGPAAGLLCMAFAFSNVFVGAYLNVHKPLNARIAAPQHFVR